MYLDAILKNFLTADILNMLLSLTSRSALAKRLATPRAGTSRFHGCACPIKCLGDLHSHPGSLRPCDLRASNYVSPCVHRYAAFKSWTHPLHGLLLHQLPQACARLFSLPNKTLKVSSVVCLVFLRLVISHTSLKTAPVVSPLRGPQLNHKRSLTSYSFLIWLFFLLWLKFLAKIYLWI